MDLLALKRGVAIEGGHGVGSRPYPVNSKVLSESGPFGLLSLRRIHRRFGADATSPQPA